MFVLLSYENPATGHRVWRELRWPVLGIDVDLPFSRRKFGKQIQRRQLDLPEYAASFVNYKSLKKAGLHLEYVVM
jgi:hypothetical protein